MWRLVCNIVRAAFVLPCSAGLIKKRRNSGFSVHDGSIAGVVLLATTVVIIFEIIVVLPIEKSRLLMVGLFCVGIVGLIMCSFIVRCNQETMRRVIKPSDKLKLTFLWLFVAGNVTHQTLALVSQFICKVHGTQITVFYIFTWIFQVFQTLFIHYFTRFKFPNTLALYYGLLSLFVTNISMWTQHTVYKYANKHSITPSNDSQSADDLPCTNNTVLPRVVEIVEPYLDPMSLEYCLLSLIFISEMWPKQTSTYHQQSDELYDVESYFENQPLLINSVNLAESETPWRITSIRVLIISLLYTTVFIIIGCVFIYIPGTKDYIFISYTVFLIGNIVRIPVIIRCFYAFLSELRPKQSASKWINLNHIVIITSSFATCGYLMIQIFKYTGDALAWYVVNQTLRMLATILQTLFILQMKQYTKPRGPQSFCSIQNTFLFMCCSNFGMWFSNTFIIPRYRKNGWKNTAFESFYFPFVVFYHFECFVSFYRFYRE